jgi:hypothetical protein
MIPVHHSLNDYSYRKTFLLSKTMIFVVCLLTNACTTNADNQRDYSEMTYSDVSYTQVKTDVQTKGTDAKDKAKIQSVGERARSNRARVGRAVRRKKWTWRVVPTK